MSFLHMTMNKITNVSYYYFSLRIVVYYPIFDANEIK